MSENEQSYQQKGKKSFLNPAHTPQYLACGILSLGGFLGGTFTGWSSTALPSIKSSNHFPGLTPTDLSWIASIATLGCLAGCPAGGYLIRVFGRKNSMTFSSIPYAIGWLALAFPLQVWMLYFGRFLTGFGLGILTLSASVYLSEIAVPELRGRLSVIWFVIIRIGTLFEYGIGSILPYNQVSAISVLLAISLGVSIVFVPESPRWLLSKMRRDDAVKSLCWLRACKKDVPSQNIVDEIEEIERVALKTEKENKEFKFSSYFRNGPVIKSILIASTLMFFKEACGGNAFAFFAVQIFENIGSPFNSHTSGVLVGVAQLGGIVITVFCVDKVGRRLLLNSAFVIMSLSLATLGLFQQYEKEIDDLSQKSEWIPLICFVFYHVAFCGGPFVLAYTVSSEIIPTYVIGSVSGLVTAIGWMTAFIFARCYQDMNDGIGVANTFWLFALFSGVGALCVYFLVPETVGRSLENIHEQGANDNYEMNNDEETV
ncbi:unnamed protein product [Orchesella dallaii]|uniref:Major facilitator superfamily (MFS) profile domain-containing protein n=1 Tax=Orchesella dallaii TaxID=48710 RepID=A0ABP1RLN9_9HEXA